MTNFRFGRTTNGQLFTESALSPGEADRPVNFPDRSAQEMAILNSRDNYTIPKPSGLTGNWSMLHIEIPTENQLSVFVAWAAGGAPPPDNVLATVFGYMATAGSEVGTLTPSHAQWAVSPVNSNYYVQWRGIRGLDFPPSNTPGVVLPGTPSVVTTNGDKWRPVFYSSTAHYNAASLTDQGIVTHGLVATDSQAFSVTKYGGVDTSAVPRVSLIRTIDIPADEADLTEADAKVYVDRPKFGSYAPARSSNAENEFISLEYAPAEPGVGNSWEDSIANGGLILGGNDSIQSGTIISAFDPIPFPVFASAFYMTGVTFWIGMDATTSINFKIKSCIEVTVDKHSAYGPFVGSPSVADEDALKAFAILSQVMPHGMPASCNDWDTFMKFVRGALSGVEDISSALAGLGMPFAGPINRIAGGINQLIR
jgi:hypothetical protein